MGNFQGYLDIGGVVGAIESSYIYNCYNSSKNILGNSNIGNFVGNSINGTATYISWVDNYVALGFNQNNGWSNYVAYTQERMKTMNSGLLTLLKNADGAGKWAQDANINGGYPYLVNNKPD